MVRPWFIVRATLITTLGWLSMAPACHPSEHPPITRPEHPPITRRSALGAERISIYGKYAELLKSGQLSKFRVVHPMDGDPYALVFHSVVHVYRIVEPMTQDIRDILMRDLQDDGVIFDMPVPKWLR